MTSLTFKFEIEEQWAISYKNAKPAEKLKIKAFMQDMFKRALIQDKVRANMYTALDTLHNEAEANGITDELLEELLADES